MLNKIKVTVFDFLRNKRFGLINNINTYLEQ